MGWTRAELKARAKYSLRANYWKSVLVAFILMLIGGGVSSSGSSDRSYTGNEYIDAVGGQVAGPWVWVLGLGMVVVFAAVVVGLVLTVFVINPLNLGCKKYFLDASDGNANLGNLGYAFQNCYTNVTYVLFLQDLFLVLWTCLFIIPGIYKAYEYRMIPYLLSEDAQLSFTQAKNLSRDMMQGEKWNAFVLDVSFIFWELLSACTLGLVGVFWVDPYYQLTGVELYKVLRTRVPGPYYNGNQNY
jgi:uncharacterized membrane protein